MSLRRLMLVLREAFNEPEPIPQPTLTERQAKALAWVLELVVDQTVEHLMDMQPAVGDEQVHDVCALLDLLEGTCWSTTDMMSRLALNITARDRYLERRAAKIAAEKISTAA